SPRPRMPGGESTEPCTSRLCDDVEQVMSRTVVRSVENVAFRCVCCATAVLPRTGGRFRNHCPRCLCSVHLDVQPGDRAAKCGAVMRPVAVEHRRSKGWVVVHECTRCGTRRRNRLALDEPVQPDDPVAVASANGARRI